MPNKKLHLFIAFSPIAAILSLTGCATSAIPEYTAPNPTKISSSKIYTIPFDSAWDKLVRNLSSDFFVINNIDKSSRIINVSFSSSEPSQYIDCGNTVRTFKNATLDETYRYQVANSSNFIAANKQFAAARVYRKTKLEGRVNIYVAPEGLGTVVNVNTKYVFTVTTGATTFAGQVLTPVLNTYDFSTKSPLLQPGPEGLTCNGTGTIENRVFGFLDS